MAATARRSRPTASTGPFVPSRTAAHETGIDAPPAPGWLSSRRLETPLVRASVTRKFCALLSIPESEFARYFDICDLEEGKWNDVMGLEVRPTVSPPPVDDERGGGPQPVCHFWTVKSSRRAL